MHTSDESSQPVQPALIACSQAMKEVLRLASRAAASDAIVLIQGETGTGKEVVARYIHRHSARANGPFVPVNCGAYTDSLLASELFGHVRGAFTGAVADRAGVFESASQGTVFLDEIGTMSPAMQVKMTRVLQEKRVLRVGASREMPVDARVVAATNADLAELVKTKQFREDLYYRVKVVSCRIPPLRERREDIKPLIDHFLDYFSRTYGKHDIRLFDSTERTLLEHPWPGNVRQLRSEIEQVVTMADSGTVVMPAQLSPEVHGAPAVAATPVADATYQELLDVWTQELVTQRLARSNGNITKTAQSLAISRSTLYALLKKYGIHGQDE